MHELNREILVILKVTDTEENEVLTVKRIALLVCATVGIIAGIIGLGMQGQRDVAVVTKPAVTQQLVQEIQVEAEVVQVQEQPDGIRIVELTAMVAKEEAEHVDMGDQVVVTVQLEEQQNAHGTISRIETNVRKTIRGGTVRNEKKIWMTCTTNAAVFPGVLAETVILADIQDNAVLVPWNSVVEQNGSYYVWVQEGQLAKKRQVEIGRELQEWTEIKSGVHAQDIVIVTPPENVSEDRFRVREVQEQ